MQSLQNKVLEHTIVQTKPGKKGKLTVSTTTYAITGTQILALAIIYGIVNMDMFKSLIGGGGEIAGDVAEGAGAWAGTVKRFGLGFHFKWRGMSRDERNKFREEIGKAETWMPPGYPAMWK